MNHTCDVKFFVRDDRKFRDQDRAPNILFSQFAHGRLSSILLGGLKLDEIRRLRMNHRRPSLKTVEVSKVCASPYDGWLCSVSSHEYELGGLS